MQPVSWTARPALVGGAWILVLGLMLAAFFGLSSAPTAAGPSAPAATTTCTPNWYSIFAPGSTGYRAEIGAVLVAGFDATWAGGHWIDYYGTQNAGLFRLTNIGWTPTLIGAGNGTIQGMAATGPYDMWAVGYNYPGVDTHTTLIAHGSGGYWQTVPSPNPAGTGGYLNSVAAVSTNDVWAVGATDTQQPLIEHWNGTTWSIVPSAALTSPIVNLTGVSAVSTNDVWAVGLYAEGNFTRPLTEHWDGTAWTLVPSPARTGASTGLNGVAAVSATDVWAVGGSQPGSPPGLLLHWDGAAWTTATGPDVSKEYAWYAVTARAANDVWAVGDYREPANNVRHVATAHWDGVAWADVPPTDPANTPSSLLAVTDAGGGNLLAVGRFTTTTSQPLVEFYGCGVLPGPVATSVMLTPLPSPQPSVAPSVIPGCNVTWADVPGSDGFYPPITNLACRTIVGGYPCGGVNPQTGQPEPCIGGAGAAPNTSPPYYRPGNWVSRGQAAKIIALSAGLTGRYSRQTFADVPATSPFFVAVEALAAHGLANGYRCGTSGEPCDDATRPYFRPNTSITRGQLAKMIGGAANFGTVPPGQIFADVPVTNGFYGWVQQVGSRGIIGGYACGGPNEPCDSANRPYYRPAGPATRAQTAKIDAGVFP